MESPREKFQPCYKLSAGNEDFIEIGVAIKAGRKSSFYKHGNPKVGEFLL